MGLLDIERIRSAIRPQLVGRRLRYLDTIDSTNSEAWRCATDPEPSGLVVLAERQTAGRGRMGRTWESPRGAGLLCSLLLLDNERRFVGPHLGLVAAVCACDAVRSATGVHSVIKWPNDLLVKGRKLGGILVEGRAQAPQPPTYVIGIGINCLQQDGHFPDDLRRRATSLDMESSAPVDRHDVVIRLLHELDHWLACPSGWQYRDLRDAWRARAEPAGMPVRIRQGGHVYQGTIEDVDPAAALVVRLDSGALRVFNAVDATIES